MYRIPKYKSPRSLAVETRSYEGQHVPSAAATAS